VNVLDSAGGDIDRASVAGTVQDGWYNQLEGFLGGVRAGVAWRPTRHTRHQYPTYGQWFDDITSLQDQVWRTSHEEDHTQSTKASPILHPTLAAQRRHKMQADVLV